jgi:hypothetical protein
VAVPLRDWAIGGHAGRTYRSVYRTGAPPASLTAAVDRFWVGEPGWPRGIRLLPDGCVDLVWTGRAVTVFPAGIGPKRLHRVLRFRRFVGHLGQLADGRRGLAELAAELGYADQAHLGRECLQLAGASPAALVELYRRPVRGRGGPDETG